MRSRRRVRLLEELGSSLLTIEKPARYLGGEVGAIPALAPDEEPDFVVGLSFPDLYEIGMSNNAIRILYSGLNRRVGVRCERVFAPAPDFEKLLKSRSLPLSTLESGLAVADVDLLGFSIGYELAATNILTILDTAGIALSASERKEGDPIVMGGGPAISNPHYLAKFLDAAWIGEAEEAFFELCGELAALKRSGASRRDLLDRLAQNRHVWMPGKKAIRAIYYDFPTSDYRMTFPLPVLKPVQAHGTVEIMRGCPHGCRFCHAGFYYRPQRMKRASLIREEVRELVEKGGYREITLASLSSGDYSDIRALLESLNSEWAPRGVSFQLPSLKVNTFTLPLIEALSEVRKSGLTFAVESPEDFRQLVINKDVSFEKIVEIIGEARTRGFRSAKFYFMIGLPVPGRGRGEAEAIVDFFSRLNRIHPIAYNVNVGVFVPKPHTPFQWCGQLGEDEAMEAIQVLRAGLRPFRSIKLSWHSPFVSLLESIFARGDERVGELILEAWKRGARLDAWEEHFDRERWRGVLDQASWNPQEEAGRPKNTDEFLAWDDVSIRVSRLTLLREWQRSQVPEFTSACTEECTAPCGACSDSHGVVYNTEQPQAPRLEKPTRRAEQAFRLILRFSKLDQAAFYPHLSLLEALARALQIADLPLSFSEGFNPSPRLELSPPLPMGATSLDEYLSAVLAEDPAQLHRDLSDLVSRISTGLPSGISITGASLQSANPDGRRFPAISNMIVSNRYRISARPASSLELIAQRLTELARTHNLSDFSAELSRTGLLVDFPVSTSKETGLRNLLGLSVEAPLTPEDIHIERLLSFGRAGDQLLPLSKLLDILDL